MNEVAKKLVARAARADVRQYRERAQRGASIDQLTSDAWQQALVEHPEFREWRGAEEYFGRVFTGEIERES